MRYTQQDEETLRDLADDVIVNGYRCPRHSLD
jgi:hypothetical protein